MSVEMIEPAPGSYKGEPIVGSGTWQENVANFNTSMMKYARQQQAMVNDASIDSRASLAQKLGFAGNMSAETLDYLTQAQINDYYAEKAFNRELNADAAKYQRAMKDMIAAGLNPAQVLGSLSGSNPGYSPASVSGGYYSEAARSKRESGVKAATGVMAGIAVLAAAMIKLIA